VDGAGTGLSVAYGHSADGHEMVLSDVAADGPDAGLIVAFVLLTDGRETVRVLHR